MAEATYSQIWNSYEQHTSASKTCVVLLSLLLLLLLVLSLLLFIYLSPNLTCVKVCFRSRQLEFFLLLWSSQCSPLPSSSYSKPWDCVRMNFSRIDYSKIPAHPDELSNLSPTIYMWLCDKLNVLDKSRHLDWRMVACKLNSTSVLLQQLEFHIDWTYFIIISLSIKATFNISQL